MGKILNWPSSGLRTLVCEQCGKRCYRAFSSGPVHCRQCGTQLIEHPPANSVESSPASPAQTKKRTA